jgi:hypothetical protein
LFNQGPAARYGAAESSEFDACQNGILRCRDFGHPSELCRSPLAAGLTIALPTDMLPMAHRRLMPLNREPDPLMATETLAAQDSQEMMGMRFSDSEAFN